MQRISQSFVKIVLNEVVSLRELSEVEIQSLPTGAFTDMRSIPATEKD